MSCLWLNPIALPFAVILMLLYRLFQGSPDNESTFAYALALICIAVFVRAILLPFTMKGKRGMLKQTRLQPKIAELQKRHGANKQKLNEEMAKLYKEEGVNPASGCLWNFLSMPIMIALFLAIRQPISLMMGLEADLWLPGRDGFNTAGEIYKALSNILSASEMESVFNTADYYAELKIAQVVSNNWDYIKNLGIDGLHRISFYLGNINLAEVPNWRVWEFDWSGKTWGSSLILFFLPVLSGGAQFVSAHINRQISPQPVTADGKAPGGAIMKFMPLMSVWFGFILPGALSLYWTIGTGLQIAQDIWLTKRYTRILDEEDEVNTHIRKQREAEIEAKRLETERLKAEGIAAENRNVSKRKKQNLEKQEQKEKAAQWEKKNNPSGGKKESDEPGRVGERRFARGRAYDPGRYTRYSGADSDKNDADSDLDTSINNDTADDDSYTGYDEDAGGNPGGDIKE